MCDMNWNLKLFPWVHDVDLKETITFFETHWLWLCNGYFKKHAENENEADL